MSKKEKLNVINLIRDAQKTVFRRSGEGDGHANSPEILEGLGGEYILSNVTIRNADELRFDHMEIWIILFIREVKRSWYLGQNMPHLERNFRKWGSII